jgi:hypothetical protein
MFMYAGSILCATSGPGHAFWRASNVCLPAMRVMYGRLAEACRNCVLIMAQVYRVYFVRRGQALVILLAGGDKGSQKADIRRALILARNLSS